MQNIVHKHHKHSLSCFGLACDTRQWQLQWYRRKALEAVREYVAAKPSSYNPQIMMPARSIAYHQLYGPSQAANGLQHQPSHHECQNKIER